MAVLVKHNSVVYPETVLDNRASIIILHTQLGTAAVSGEQAPLRGKGVQYCSVEANLHEA